MLLLFIRHGETVDNVAGLYAGVRDSELTNFGVSQARRLGRFLEATRPPVSTIFASSLSRASRTAEAILDAQTKSSEEGRDASSVTATPHVDLMKSSLIIEQDFGFYEGKPFHSRSRDKSKSGKAAHRETHLNDPGFKDVESAESMAQRCDQFLDNLLVPRIWQLIDEPNVSVAVVSHGILLSHLWRRFLLRLSQESISIEPELIAAKGEIRLKHLGGWSNTGFLEVELTRPSANAKAQAVDGVQSDLPVPADGPSQQSGLDLQHPPPFTGPGPVGAASEASNAPPTSNSSKLYNIDVHIKAINGREHLRGIKRARGGIGSAKYDDGQTNLDAFFKRAKNA